MKSFKEIINESGGGLSRINQHVQGRNIGTITAHRGHLSAEENNHRNEQLKNDLKAHNFGYKKVTGKYIENYGKKDIERPVEEKSFLVIGKKGDDKGQLKDFLLKHGQKYDQDSILHKAHNEEHANLIGTNDTGYPGKGVVSSVGKFHPDKVAEFHSSHKGKNYTFESLSFYDEAPSKTFLNRSEQQDTLIETIYLNEATKPIEYRVQKRLNNVNALWSNVAVVSTERAAITKANNFLNQHPTMIARVVAPNDNLIYQAYGKTIEKERSK